MPLLGKKIFVSVKPLTNRKPEETVYSIPHTKEQFRSKPDYEKRISLYEDRIWTCRSTGHTNLTHEEAWNSEKTVRKSVKSQYQTCYEKPVLDVVHHSTHSLETLVDQTWLKLQQVLSIDEKVSLKIRNSGKVIKANVVRVDTCGIEANPTSNCSSPSSDKENTNGNSVNKDTGQKKWIPPKLLPYKYSIKLEDEDKIINCVPAADLIRVDRPPAKELLRLFIRTHALRTGEKCSSPWVVDETMIKKYNILNKIADVFLSPMKVHDPSALNGSGTKKRKSMDNSGSSSPKKAKTEKDKVKKNDKKKKDDSDKKKKKQSKLDVSTKKNNSTPKKSPNHKTKTITIDTSDGDSDSSEECSLGALKKKFDDVPLMTLKLQLTPVKNKKSDSRQSTPKKDTPKKNTPKKGTPKKNKSPQKDQKKKKSSKDDDKKKKKEKKLKEKEKKKDKSKDKETPKKGKNMKQMTLLEMSAKKTPRTPDKKKTVTASSPQKPPLIVRRLMAAMKDKDNNKAEYKKYLQRVVQNLTEKLRQKLPPEIKDVVIKAYEAREEKKKLKSLSPEEREAYLKQKKQENHQKQLQKRRELKRKYEDKDLQHKALPQPKEIDHPDGIPVDAFADVAMIIEFVNCYSGLLMPQDEQVFYSDLLMKALVDGNDGFPYISQILVILLQTLLQDEISEDYSELNTSLSDIPINPYTASELIRLALRKNDIEGPEETQSDDSSENAAVEELEVSEELIGKLVNHELHELDANQKLQILKGLCLRIMNTYSVQDYMEQKQSDASALWRRKLSTFKERKETKELEKKLLQEKIEDVNDTKENNPQNGNVTDQRDIKNSGLTITDFYGNKIVEDEGELSDGCLASVVKRRRQRSAVAAKEKEKRDKEERERREKENVILRKIREEQAFEKEFADGILLAKMSLRLSPIGTDRNHSRYWIFSKSTPGLYIESGWIHPDAIELSISESSDEDDVSDSQNFTEYKRDNIETSFPRPEQNVWFVYNTVEQLEELMTCLNPQGVRESALISELKKGMDEIRKNLNASKRVPPKEDSVEKDVMAALKQEIKETETRLRNGGLGGVFGLEEWEEKLEKAASLSEVGKCLLETKDSVLERFLQGMMGKSKLKKKDSEKKDGTDKNEDTENHENEVKEEEEEKELINVGYQKWKEAIEGCQTVSRMHVLLGILDACIRWEKSAENAKCKICRKKAVGEQLILCDECNQPFHLYCLRPALQWIPEGDWYCPSCVPQSERRSRRKPKWKGYKERSDDEESSSDDGDDDSEEIEHETNCVVCDGDDELIECSQCPDVYHLDCHDPPLRHAPRGHWTCTPCRTGRRRRKKRKSKQTVKQTVIKKEKEKKTGAQER